jgi:DNA-binding NarL/FixJ family response regulator
MVKKMSGLYRILLADDHAMFRRGVREIIQSIGDLDVVGEASDGFELLELVKKTSPQMAIIDISMPNLRGLEATWELKNIDPAVKVLIVTMHKDKEYLHLALKTGAQGYLLKEDTDTELLTAIDTLRKGGTYISHLLSTQLADLFMERSRPASEQAANFQELLTTREREIIKLIAEGKTSKESGDLLFISSKTVLCHRANIMKKLNIKKPADLVKYAIQKGYIPHEL